MRPWLLNGWTEAARKLPGCHWVRGSNSQTTSCRQRPKLPLTGIRNRGLYRMDGNRLACLWFMCLHRYPSKCAWVKLYSNCYLHVQKWITEELWLWRQVLGWILALHAATQSSNWLMLTPSEASWRRWQRGVDKWVNIVKIYIIILERFGLLQYPTILNQYAPF